MGNFSVCSRRGETSNLIEVLVNVWQNGAVPTGMKRRITGQYENRLRLYSAPQKVFEYFSSVQVSGRVSNLYKCADVTGATPAER